MIFALCRSGFAQEAYNPEAPAIRGPRQYWNEGGGGGQRSQGHGPRQPAPYQPQQNPRRDLVSVPTLPEPITQKHCKTPRKLLH